MTPNQTVGGTTLVMPQLYERSEGLHIRPPHSVCIIGVGGVGSWVAYFLAIAGTSLLCLIDPDTLEEHNLGRTPYKMWHIDKPKVHALAELIYELRPMCNVMAYPSKWEDLDETDKKLCMECDEVIDCRDSVSVIEGLKKTAITGGYDGTDVTIHVAPDYSNIWGDGEVRYTVTPSYFGAPAMIAIIIVNYLCLERWSRGGRLGEFTFSFDMKKLVRKLAGKRRYNAAPAPEVKDPEEADEEPVPVTAEDVQEVILEQANGATVFDVGQNIPVQIFDTDEMEFVEFNQEETEHLLEGDGDDGDEDPAQG